jgi:hypothetical protein
MDTEELVLKEFDMSSIPQDSILVFIGKRNTGKSFLVKDFLYHHQDMPKGVVISGTERVNPFYGDMIPKAFIHYKYKPDVISNVLSLQERIVTKYKDKLKNNLDTDNPNCFLIMDDCLYDNSWKKDEGIAEIFMNGRHYKLMFILTMQYSLGITPYLRGNIDYVFIMREPLTNNRKKLYEHYCSMFPTFDIFCQVMDACTEDYQCLVIHNGSKSNKIEDQVFYYKAKPHDNFKIGDKKFWAYHDNNYSTTDSTVQVRGNNSYPKQYRGKNKPVINIKKI